MKGLIEIKRPRQHINGPSKFREEKIKRATRQVQVSRQMDIDQENNVLLEKIMGIMKRKNKSVMHVRNNRAST